MRQFQAYGATRKKGHTAAARRHWQSGGDGGGGGGRKRSQRGREGILLLRLPCWQLEGKRKNGEAAVVMMGLK